MKVFRLRMGQLILVLTMIGLLFPIYWLVQSSISTQNELFHTPSYLFPPSEPGRVSPGAARNRAGPRQLCNYRVRERRPDAVHRSQHGLWAAPVQRVGAGGAVVRLLILMGLVFPHDHVCHPAVPGLRRAAPSQLVPGINPGGQSLHGAARHLDHVHVHADAFVFLL